MTTLTSEEGTPLRIINSSYLLISIFFPISNVVDRGQKLDDKATIVERVFQ
jgi:hypothetical protein